MSHTKRTWQQGYGRCTTYKGVAPPLELDWIGHWLTPHEFAQQMGRSYGAVMSMISRGTLTACNISHFRDRRGRIWIESPLI